MKKLVPIEVPWSPRDALMAFLLAWMGVPFGIVYALKLSAPYNGMLKGFLEAFRNGGIEVSFIFALISGIVSLMIIGLYLRHYKVGWKALGWRRFSLLKAILYIAVGLVAFIVAIELAFWLVAYLFPQFNVNQPQTNEFTSPTSSATKNLSLIALVVLPPIIEESLFRGFIFPAMSKWGGVVVGAVITSLLFGLAHLQYNVGVYTIVLSLILCAMYYRLKSIWPGVLLHMLNNYLAFVALVHK